MALRPLHPTVKEPLIPGWEIVATEAGRTGRGIKATLVLMNGEPKACHSIALGYAPEQNQFTEAVYNLCGADEATVKALLPKLAYIIEDVLRQMAEKHLGKDDLPGTPLAFDDLDPWDTPVDGAALLTALADTYATHIILPPGGKEALALWTLHTYTHEAAFVSPYIVLSSPQKRSGKSTTLIVASALVHRALMTNNISSAALFRTIEACSPTLLIDEADTFARENDELRGILNSGHTRRTAFVIRTVGEEHEPRQFSTWAPKMIAGIGKLPDTLRDRSIVLKMQRRKPDETVEKWREQYAEALVDVRRRCLRWAEDHLRQLHSITPDIPGNLHDRAADNWTPLCAIAAVAGGEWPERTRRAIGALEALDESEDENVAITLLADLRTIFVANHHDDLSTKELLEQLHEMEERPWPEWGKSRKPINTRQLADLLAPFGVRSKNLRKGNTVPKGYKYDNFTDVFARYLPSQSATPLQPNNDADLHAESIRYTEGSVADEKTGDYQENQGRSGVADSTGGNATPSENVAASPLSAIATFVATELYCPQCKQSQPVEENYPEYLCAVCKGYVGDIHRSDDDDLPF